jgi:hypothetical protein
VGLYPLKVLVDFFREVLCQPLPRCLDAPFVVTNEGLIEIDQQANCLAGTFLL